MLEALRWLRPRRREPAAHGDDDDRDANATAIWVAMVSMSPAPPRNGNGGEGHEGSTTTTMTTTTAQLRLGLRRGRLVGFILAVVGLQLGLMLLLARPEGLVLSRTSSNSATGTSVDSLNALVGVLSTLVNKLLGLRLDTLLSTLTAFTFSHGLTGRDAREHTRDRVRRRRLRTFEWVIKTIVLWLLAAAIGGLYVRPRSDPGTREIERRLIDADLGWIKTPSNRNDTPPPNVATATVEETSSSFALASTILRDLVTDSTSMPPPARASSGPACNRTATRLSDQRTGSPTSTVVPTTTTPVAMRAADFDYTAARFSFPRREWMSAVQTLGPLRPIDGGANDTEDDVDRGRLRVDGMTALAGLLVEHGLDLSNAEHSWLMAQDNSTWTWNPRAVDVANRTERYERGLLGGTDGRVRVDLLTLTTAINSRLTPHLGDQQTYATVDACAWQTEASTNNSQQQQQREGPDAIIDSWRMLRCAIPQDANAIPSQVIAQRQSDTAILAIGIGYSVSGRGIRWPGGDMTAFQLESPIKVLHLTVVRLSWAAQDLAGRFNGSCAATTLGKCLGVGWELHDGRLLLLGLERITAVARRLTVRERLVTLYTPSPPWELLKIERFVGNAITTDGALGVVRDRLMACDGDDARSDQQSVANYIHHVLAHGYMIEDPRSVVVGSLLFRLFSEASVIGIESSTNNAFSTMTPAFAGNRQLTTTPTTTLVLQMPRVPAFLALGVVLLLLLVTLVVVMLARRLEAHLNRHVDARTVAEVLVSGSWFSRIFTTARLVKATEEATNESAAHHATSSQSEDVHTYHIESIELRRHPTPDANNDNNDVDKGDHVDGGEGQRAPNAVVRFTRARSYDTGIAGEV